jgi:C4-dicarboxylate-specific signal transduction histidine kinase
MAHDREIVEEAFAGDIIGLFDPGLFSIGDTLCLSNEKFRFEPIPTFAPEQFARITQRDTMKRKQFVKGMEQIAREGGIQIFKEPGGGMEEVYVGAEEKKKGMDEKLIKQIFEPFFTTKNNGDGLGLGLSIIKKIVKESFSGEISVRSKVNHGSTFIINIPPNKI